MASERRRDGYGERKAHRPILATTQSVRRPRAMPRWLRVGLRTFGGRHRAATPWGTAASIRPAPPRMSCRCRRLRFKSAGRGFSYLTPCLCGPWCFTTEARSFWMPSARRRMTYNMEAFLVAALACAWSSSVGQPCCSCELQGLSHALSSCVYQGARRLSG